MNLADEQKIKENMDFVNSHTFSAYLKRYTWIWTLMPLIICLGDLLSDGFSGWVILRAFVMMLSGIAFLYSQYTFFKNLTKENYSFTKLFWYYFFTVGGYMAACQFDFAKFATDPHYSITVPLFSGLCFGLFAGLAFAGISHENIKNHLEKRSTQLTDSM